MYYLQSRYYNPNIGRFLNADALVATGQGVLGNNMFAYCLNNPVAYSDSQGTDAKVCFAADGTIDEIPWWDHSPGGGGFVYHCDNITTDYSGDKFYIQKAMRYVKIGLGYAWEGVKDSATWLWDAYMRGYNLQQEAQLQNAQALIEGVEYFIENPKKAETLLRDMTMASYLICDAVTIIVACSPPGQIAAAVALAALAIWDVSWSIGDVIADFP